MDNITGRISRRKFLGLAAATAAATLSGCGPARPQASSPSDGKIQLVYQDWRTDWFPPMARAMLAEFHEMHPNIKVFYVPDPDDVGEKMLSDMRAGTAPDVFQGCCDFLPVWAQAGYMLDLRPFVAADLDQATIDEWDQAQYRAFFTEDGLQFALPKYHGALALYYNKSLFDEYGVDYPDAAWTYTDYTTAMQRLTRDRSATGQGGLWGSMVDIDWERLQVHVNGWGGHLVDPGDPRRCRLAEPEALAAFNWLYERMWQDRSMATSLDVNKMETRQAFASGQVAMVEDGSWALKDILSQANFRVGVAPFPAGPARRVTLATTDGFGIYAGTRYPEAAWELVKFLISKDYGRAMAQASFLQPARASLIDEWIRFVQQEFPDQAQGIDLAAFADGQLNGYSVTAEIFANMADARRLAYAAWDKIFTLGQGSVEQMNAVCRQIEAAQ
ncbi:MAG: sugar ABC transporter substrate-binding protein [Anaerolineae bacterium]|nr:sugar ABC transporter substrate-binding protein [Anaerolineae bacterium]